MAVSIEQIKPGAVFRFKTAPRRVKSISNPVGGGFHVNWEYADGRKRGGRLTGSQWVYYFKADAIEEIPDPARSGESRQLLPEGKVAPCLSGVAEITLRTHCPAKWAMVDMETGELWGHNGTQFKRLNAKEAADVATVALLAAKNESERESK